MIHSRRSIVIVCITIACLAIAIRLPSCGESLWVDELHTAWVINDSWSDIPHRAAMGHQQPYYFQALWCWKQCFGASEVALRASSVLATAVACALVAASVVRITHSLMGGALSGLYLAIESNAIFFGTELRPYALVLLASAVCSSIVASMWMSSDTSPARHSWRWVALCASVAFASLMQITSLGLLVWFPWIILVRDTLAHGRMTLRWTRYDWFVLAIGILTVIALAPSRIIDVWSMRAMWAGFASATHPSQIYRLWPWTITLVLPLGLALAFGIASKFHSRQRWFVCTPATRLLVALATLSIGVTALFWLLAWSHVAPVWHRRYMTGSLALFAICFGSAIAIACKRVSVRPGRSSLAMAAVGGALLLCLVSSQRVLPKLLQGQTRLVSRGEHWRDAIAFVNREAATHDRIAMDPGLIEQTQWHSDLARRDLPLDFDRVEYLSYPVRSIYPLDSLDRVFPVPADLSTLDTFPGETLWIVSRSRVEKLEKRLSQRFDTKFIDVFQTEIEVIGFGNVSVAKVKTERRD